MKFTQYQPAIQPTTIGGGANKAPELGAAYGYTDPKTTVDARDSKLWATAMDTVAKVAVKKQGEQDAMDLLDLQNKVNTELQNRLYNPEDGLFTTSLGENAKGLTDRTAEVIKETTDKYIGDYNGRVQQAFQKTYADNVQSYMKTAYNQMTAEKNKIDELNLTAYLSNNMDLADYHTNNSIANNVNKNNAAIEAFGISKGWGSDIIVSKKREFTSKLVNDQAQLALEAGDTTRAREITNNFRTEIDNKTWRDLDSAIKKKEVKIEQDDFLKNLPKNGNGRIDKLAAYQAAENKWGKSAGHWEGGTANLTNPHLWEIAQKVSQLSGVKSHLVYGQLIAEYGAGSNPEADKNHNYAGMHGGQGYHYDNDDEFCEDFAATLRNIPGAKEATNSDELTRAMKAENYFTSDDVDGRISTADQYANEALGGGSGNIPALADVVNANVNIDGLTDNFSSKLAWAFDKFYKDTGIKLYVTSANDGDHDDQQHYNGNAIDVVGGMGDTDPLDDAATRDKLIGYLHDAGVTTYDEYVPENHTSKTTDNNLHISNDTDKEAPAAGNSSRWVSNYNPDELERVKNKIDAMINDEEREINKQKKEFVDGLRKQILHASSESEAREIIDANSDALGGSDEASLIGTMHTKFPKTSKGAKTNEEGLTKSEVDKYNVATRRIIARGIEFANDPDKTPTANQWIQLSRDADYAMHINPSVREAYNSLNETLYGENQDDANGKNKFTNLLYAGKYGAAFNYAKALMPNEWDDEEKNMMASIMMGKVDSSFMKPRIDNTTMEESEAVE